MDLFEPGSRSQVHDINGAVLTSGLFWTLPLDDADLRVSDDGRRAVLEVEDLQVIESFRLFGPNTTPATLPFGYQHPEHADVARDEISSSGRLRLQHAASPGMG